MNLKSVCFLLNLCHAGSVAALGLGELTVRSHLGQALHVTVKILGANTTTAADCFSLAPSEGAAVPPPRAQFSLDQGGGQPLLHIRTPYAIHDPIAQFALVSDCESRQQRDYVVLLDPPALAAPASGHAIPVVAAQEKAPRTESARPASRPAPPRPANTDKAKPAPFATHPSTPAARPAPPRNRAVAQDDQAPRLVLWEDMA